MISIIIPTYNSAKTLPRALESVYQNDFKDFEVIVVDDGGTDNTPDLVKNYPVIYERLEQNKGAAFARNRGAQIAKSDILLFVDSDMEVKENLLSSLNEQFRSTDYDVITGCFAPEPKVDSIFLLFISSLSNYNFSKTKFVFSTHLAAVRKNVFKEINGFDERFKGATVEDFDLYHRLLLNGYKCKTDMDMEAYHYHHFTFRTFFKRMFLFGLLKTPLILHYGKDRQIRNQEKRYLVNSEYIFSYLLILFLVPSVILTFFPRFHLVLPLWILSYGLVKLNYLRSLKRKHFLMFVLSILNDSVVLTGCILGALGYCRDKILDLITNKSTGIVTGDRAQKLQEASTTESS